MKPRTPSIPGQDIQLKFYGESFAGEQLQILQRARPIAKENIEEKQKQYKDQHDKTAKDQHDKTAKDHDFSIGQQVWYLQTEFIGKNKKLAPKYLGPATIIDINKSVAKIKTDKNKVEMLNVNKLKHFFPGEDKEEDTKNHSQKAEKLIKFDLTMTRPLTRAWSKLIKNTAAISALINKSDTASSKEIWYKLNCIAYKLYHLNLDLKQLTTKEIKFWKKFKQEDIFSGYQEALSIRRTIQNTFIYRFTFDDPPPVQPPQQPPVQPPQQPNQQPGPAVQNQVPQPSPRQPGRPLGSKNKPKDLLTRAAHYASKRFTRAASKVFLPDTARKNANAPF